MKDYPMIYTRLYIYSSRRDSGDNKRWYGDGAVYRPFLITWTKSPSFSLFIDAFNEKPLYGLFLSKNNTEDTGPLEHIAKLTSKWRGHKMLLIPAGLTSLTLPIFSAQATNVTSYLREGVDIGKALLFSAEDPDGYIDGDLIANPLDLLRRSAAEVNRTDIASTGEISSVLWKLRNKLNLLTLSTFEKEFCKDIIKPQEAKANG